MKKHYGERISPEFPQPNTVEDPSFRLSLLHHCVELLRELMGSMAPDPPSPPVAADSPTPVSVATESTLALSEYGDEANLHKVRMEALEVFDSRPLDVHSYVVLWLDTVQVWGHPLLVCMGATEMGERHLLNFVEAPARDLASMQALLDALLNRGLRTESGLFCITCGEPRLSQQILESLRPVGIQYCQSRKREWILSYLGETDFARIKGAMTRAYEIPVYAEAHAALLQIHADLLHCNRSAAQWLQQGLVQTLTLYQTGRIDKLSRSLRSTRCIVRVVQQLNQRLKRIRYWLPPTCPDRTFVSGVGITHASVRSCRRITDASHRMECQGSGYFREGGRLKHSLLWSAHLPGSKAGTANHSEAIRG